MPRSRRQSFQPPPTPRLTSLDSISLSASLSDLASASASASGSGSTTKKATTTTSSFPSTSSSPSLWMACRTSSRRSFRNSSTSTYSMMNTSNRSYGSYRENNGLRSSAGNVDTGKNSSSSSRSGSKNKNIINNDHGDKKRISLGSSERAMSLSRSDDHSNYVNADAMSSTSFCSSARASTVDSGNGTRATGIDGTFPSAAIVASTSSSLLGSNKGTSTEFHKPRSSELLSAVELEERLNSVSMTRLQFHKVGLIARKPQQDELYKTFHNVSNGIHNSTHSTHSSNSNQSSSNGNQSNNSSNRSVISCHDDGYRNNKRHIVYISGEAGVGKSTLAKSLEHHPTMQQRQRQQQQSQKQSTMSSSSSSSDTTGKQSQETNSTTIIICGKFQQSQGLSSLANHQQHHSPTSIGGNMPQDTGESDEMTRQSKDFGGINQALSKLVEEYILPDPMRIQEVQDKVGMGTIRVLGRIFRCMNRLISQQADPTAENSFSSTISTEFTLPQLRNGGPSTSALHPNGNAHTNLNTTGRHRTDDSSGHSTDLHQVQIQVLEGVKCLFRLASQWLDGTCPLLMILDDIQWASKEALEIIEAIIKDPIATKSSSIFIVCTYRVPPPPPSQSSSTNNSSNNNKVLKKSRRRSGLQTTGPSSPSLSSPTLTRKRSLIRTSSVGGGGGGVTGTASSTANLATTTRTISMVLNEHLQRMSRCSSTISLTNWTRGELHMMLSELLLSASASSSSSTYNNDIQQQRQQSQYENDDSNNNNNNSAIRELTSVIHRKTNGNPFFVIQFLQSLYVQKLLQFNLIALQWKWDIHQIQQVMVITDNVVDLLKQKFLLFQQQQEPSSSSTTTRKSSSLSTALRIASCLGSVFDASIVERLFDFHNHNNQGRECREELENDHCKENTNVSSSSSSSPPPSAFKKYHRQQQKPESFQEGKSENRFMRRHSSRMNNNNKKTKEKIVGIRNTLKKSKSSPRVMTTRTTPSPTKKEIETHAKKWKSTKMMEWKLTFTSTTASIGNVQNNGVSAGIDNDNNDDDDDHGETIIFCGPDGTDVQLDPAWKTIAVEEGYLESCGGNIYRFVHDKIQEAAFSSIPDVQQPLFQYQLGIYLLRSLDEDEIRHMRFVITDLVNRGELFVVDGTTYEEREKYVVLNLLAAKRAIRCCAFRLAASYCKRGISLLPPNHWRQSHAQLSLELYSILCESSFCSGDFETVKEYGHVALENTENRPIEEKHRIYFSLIDVAMAESNLDECIEMGLDALEEVGCRFPTRSSLVVVFVELVKTKRLLNHLSDDDILDLPYMTDASKFAAMKYLDRLLTAAYSRKPEFLLMVLLRMMQYTVQFGASDLTSVSLATYGYLNAIILNDWKAGRRYAELSLSTMEQEVDRRLIAARVTFLTTWFLLHWWTPYTSLLRPLENAYEIGLQIGDIENAMWCSTCHVELSLELGRPLERISRDAQTYHRQQKQLKSRQAHVTSTMVQFVTNLIGPCDDPCQLSGKVQNYENLAAANDENLIKSFHCWELRLALFFARTDKMEELVPILTDKVLQQIMPGQPLLVQMALTLSLCNIALARAFPSRATRYKRDAKKWRSTIKKWVDRGNPNCDYYIPLIDAELYSFQKEDETSAKSNYERANLMTGRRGLIHDRALINELYGKYLLRQGDDVDGYYRLKESWKLYTEWGAYSKVEEMEKCYTGSALFD